MVMLDDWRWSPQGRDVEWEKVTKVTVTETPNPEILGIIGVMANTPLTDC